MSTKPAKMTFKLSELALLRRRVYWSLRTALIGVAVAVLGASAQLAGSVLLMTAGLFLLASAYLVLRATTASARLSADQNIRSASVNLRSLITLATGFASPGELVAFSLTSLLILFVGGYTVLVLASHPGLSVLTTLSLCLLVALAAYLPVGVLRIRNATAEMLVLRQRQGDLQTTIDKLRAEDQEQLKFLDHQDKEIEWLRNELDRRPKLVRKTYKVLTIGISGSGKTSLTLKWANPLIDLGTLQGTKIERYERTVSQICSKDVIVEHVFEIGDWGGEHIVDALQELIVEEIQGLIIVVDVGSKGNTVDPNRIHLQLRAFQPEVLQYFFNAKTVASCRAIILFINKSDLLPGTLAEADRAARWYYAGLIRELERYRERIPVAVFVGSAHTGHNVHHLFSYLVERILPRNAYDNQLLRGMKSGQPDRTHLQLVAVAPQDTGTGGRGTSQDNGS